MSRASEIALTSLAVGLGAVVGFIVVTRPESIERMKNGVTDIFSTSKKKVDEMSEEVALRTARLTRESSSQSGLGGKTVGVNRLLGT